MTNAGQNGWSLFVDALDEARANGKKPARKKRIGRPKRHLADIELKALKQAEQLRKRLDKKLIEMGPDWTPDELFIDTFKSVVAAVNSLSRTYRMGQEATAKAYSKLDEEQLLKVLQSQLARFATDLSEDEWRVLLSLGMGEDIAEAAISVWKQREASHAESRRPTQFGATTEVAP